MVVGEYVAFLVYDEARAEGLPLELALGLVEELVEVISAEEFFERALELGSCPLPSRQKFWAPLWFVMSNLAVRNMPTRTERTATTTIDLMPKPLCFIVSPRIINNNKMNGRASADRFCR